MGRPALLGASRLALYAILLAYLALGTLYAVRTPAWQVPDEPAHYNYIRTLVERHALPVLQIGDYDEAYLDRLKAQRFPPDLSVAGIQYEGWQPPLYYLLAAPVFAASGGSLVAVRLFTLSLGSLVIVWAWKLARTVLPAAPGVAMVAAGFVAFLPQHLAMTAAANNDALAEVWIGLGLWLLARALLDRQRGEWEWAVLGVVLGLSFLTKLTAYPLAGLIALALLFIVRRRGWGLNPFLSATARVYLPAIGLGALWWLRNIFVYGGLDFLASTRHDAIVVGQLRTADYLAQIGPGLYVQNFLQTTFQSYWGQFGWMGVVMDRRVYLALLLYSLGLLVGLIGAVVAFKRAGRRLQPEQRDLAVLLAAALALAGVVYIYYNLTFVQFQGRYLYPTLAIVALCAGVALRQWALWLTAWLPAGAARRWAAWALPLVPIVLIAALDLYALYRFIIPALTIPS
jgi:4-amino-4-deoxy-L-arabinose transferase-like glycosyltransferase